MACRAAHSAERRMRSTLRLCRRTVGEQLSSGSGQRVLAWTSAPRYLPLSPPTNPCVGEGICSFLWHESESEEGRKRAIVLPVTGGTFQTR